MASRGCSQIISCSSSDIVSSLSFPWQLILTCISIWMCSKVYRRRLAKSSLLSTPFQRLCYVLDRGGSPTPDPARDRQGLTQHHSDDIAVITTTIPIITATTASYCRIRVNHAKAADRTYAAPFLQRDSGHTAHRLVARRLSMDIAGLWRADWRFFHGRQRLDNRIRARSAPKSTKKANVRCCIA